MGLFNSKEDEPPTSDSSESPRKKRKIDHEPPRPSREPPEQLESELSFRCFISFEMWLIAFVSFNPLSKKSSRKKTNNKKEIEELRFSPENLSESVREKPLLAESLKTMKQKVEFQFLKRLPASSVHTA